MAETMKVSLLLALLLLDAMVSSRPDHGSYLEYLNKVKQSCGRHEEFSTCVTNCPERCVPDKNKCREGCSIGCRCQWNYVRSKDDSCVRWEHC